MFARGLGALPRNAPLRYREKGTDRSAPARSTAHAAVKRVLRFLNGQKINLISGSYKGDFFQRSVFCVLAVHSSLLFERFLS